MSAVSLQVSTPGRQERIRRIGERRERRDVREEDDIEKGSHEKGQKRRGCKRKRKKETKRTDACKKNRIKRGESVEGQVALYAYMLNVYVCTYASV